MPFGSSTSLKSKKRRRNFSLMNLEHTTESHRVRLSVTVCVVQSPAITESIITITGEVYNLPTLRFISIHDDNVVKQVGKEARGVTPWTRHAPSERLLRVGADSSPPPRASLTPTGLTLTPGGSGFTDEEGNSAHLD
ncbi:hypothetical protein Bbelb_315050 [Branchiostoma belcheri]|nr:hypothetical protein Bbelb_315050 [Branchiostoma belcheri]